MASTGTGVVIGSHSLKVVQARKKGGVLKVTRVANVKLSSKVADRPLDAKKREHLVSLFEGAGVRAGEAMMGLTGRDLIVRYTHVPPVPDWRLEMLMKFEIEEVGEQSGGEVSADYTRLQIPESVSGDSTVLVALAKNAGLLPRMEILKSAGLKIRGACPNSVALFHAFTTMAKIEPGEVTLLMHIGSENTDIAIQKDGDLLFARNVSGGGRLFTEAIMNQFNVPYDRAEKMKLQKANVAPRGTVKYADSLSEKVSNAVLGVTGQFVSMVHSSVMFAKAQTKMKDLSVDKVVIAGGGANMAGLAEYLETNLGMPVVVFDPARALDLSGLPKDQVALVEADGTGLTLALGLASLCMERDVFTLEILPEEYRKRRRFVERESFLIGAGALTAALIAILFVVSSRDHAAAKAFQDELVDEERTLNELNNRYERAKAEYEAAARKIEILEDRVRTGPVLRTALSLVEKVVKEQGFDEIHITLTQTGREIRWLKELDEAGEPVGEPEAVHVVWVSFRAQIQTLERTIAAVLSDFLEALRIAASPRKGFWYEAGTQSKQMFEFRILFAPRGDPERLSKAN